MKKALVALLLVSLVACFMANMLVLKAEGTEPATVGPTTSMRAVAVGGVLIPIDKASLMASCVDAGDG